MSDNDYKRYVCFVKFIHFKFVFFSSQVGHGCTFVYYYYYYVSPTRKEINEILLIFIKKKQRIQSYINLNLSCVGKMYIYVSQATTRDLVIVI